MEENVLLNMKGVDICRKENIVLHEASFTLHNGEFVYVIGKVGTGKSSLLKSLYCEIPIKTGEAQLLDYNLCKMKRKDIPFLRRKLGIVFQDFQLLTDRSVHKNLEFVLKATGWKKKSDIHDRIEKVLAQVGIVTYAQLAKVSAQDIKTLLVESGNRITNPDNWPQQAGFAARGDWEGLANFLAQNTAA